VEGSGSEDGKPTNLEVGKFPPRKKLKRSNSVLTTALVDEGVGLIKRSKIALSQR
jgi:hypothetical protein